MVSNQISNHMDELNSIFDKSKHCEDIDLNKVKEMLVECDLLGDVLKDYLKNHRRK